MRLQRLPLIFLINTGTEPEAVTHPASLGCTLAVGAAALTPGSWEQAAASNTVASPNVIKHGSPSTIPQTQLTQPD